MVAPSQTKEGTVHAGCRRRSTRSRPWFAASISAIARRGFGRGSRRRRAQPLELLPEIGEQRLKAMDEAGITVQVLSSSGPGPISCRVLTASPWRAR
jgi:hypothetical protein